MHLQEIRYPYCLNGHLHKNDKRIKTAKSENCLFLIGSTICNSSIKIYID